MLVYSDHEQRAEAHLRAREINRRIDVVDEMPCGLLRHAALVNALIETGQLLQGLADRVFAEEGQDRRSPATDELGELLLSLGHAVCRSWDSEFGQAGGVTRQRISEKWPSEVQLRVPEGFAFYAVYPEAFAEAARRLKLQRPARVIGIRSIGTSLAAVVAAALGAPAPVTVRPFGNPSDRHIALDSHLEGELLDGDYHYVIVDEGPGRSGSSFGAVGDWLQERGVPLERIALVTSHAGPPGADATEARRHWWGEVQRQSGDFGHRWPELIAGWCGELLGPLDEQPRDLSAGRWRAMRYAREEEWPAAVPSWERRKYLVRAREGAFLVKFAGLGGAAEEKLAISKTLHSEGLAPDPVGLVHGFLIERWCEDATRLAEGEKPLREIARYIGTRARLLPAVSAGGASVDELAEMIRRNVSLEFGDAVSVGMEPLCARGRALGRRIVRVRTDNKLDRHEWLRTPSGALIKTDALDHQCAHDLVGCQDLAWDCAAAIVEFDLDQDEARQFVAAAGFWSNREVDPELLEFCRLAYLAFRIGQARLGEAMESGAAERQRLKRSGDRYADELQHLLESAGRPTRHESSVG